MLAMKGNAVSRNKRLLGLKQISSYKDRQGFQTLNGGAYARVYRLAERVHDASKVDEDDEPMDGMGLGLAGGQAGGEFDALDNMKPLSGMGLGLAGGKFKFKSIKKRAAKLAKQAWKPENMDKILLLGQIGAAASGNTSAMQGMQAAREANRVLRMDDESEMQGGSKAYKRAKKAIKKAARQAKRVLGKKENIEKILQLADYGMATIGSEEGAQAVAHARQARDIIDSDESKFDRGAALGDLVASAVGSDKLAEAVGHARNVKDIVDSDVDGKGLQLAGKGRKGRKDRKPVKAQKKPKKAVMEPKKPKKAVKKAVKEPKQPKKAVKRSKKDPRYVAELDVYGGMLDVVL